jgi:hypothetical protein
VPVADPCGPHPFGERREYRIQIDRVVGGTVLSARNYLTNPRFGLEPSVRVFDLRSSYRYLTVGYCVSLRAEARGQEPMPRVQTIEDLHSQNPVRHLAEGINESIRHALSKLKSDTFDLGIYFGRNLAKRCDT